MSEQLTLELPTESAKPRRRRWLRLLPVWVLLALGAGLAWWVWSGRVESTWAMLDGMVYPVTPDIPARVLSLAVREGDEVRAGQTVATLDMSDYARHLRESRREVTGLRLPPDATEAAARLKAAQDAELDMSQRLARARHEEESRRARRETRVAEHVRAQLALRSLDSQGGAPVVGKRRYEEARAAETRARQAMEQAREEFERASLSRAAVDQELARIREEMLRYGRQPAGGRTRYTRDALRGANAPAAAVPDGRLCAPRDGRILPGLAQPGQAVQPGEPVALLLPTGEDAAASFWVAAYFTQAQAKAIRPRQRCSIVLANGAQLAGRVLDVLPPGPLPSKAAGADAAGDALFVPVRVVLDSGETPQQPGAEARCVVSTHGLLP